MQSDILRKETSHTINGVNGRLFTLLRPPAPWKAGTFANQKWISESRKVSGWGAGGQMSVEIRFDDECKNGSNSFAITAEIVTNESRKRRDIQAGGCLHDEIREVFPELAHLIKWHLGSTDGPMYYIENTVYHASDCDYNGRKAGEPCAWDTVVYFAENAPAHRVKTSFWKFLKDRMNNVSGDVYECRSEFGEFQVVAINHDKKPGDIYDFNPKFTFLGYGEKWHECPFDDEFTAIEWCKAINSGMPVRFAKIPTDFSKGKPRNLDAARNCAVWPDATNEQLCMPKAELTALLSARLPGLLADMRSDIESAGFMWQCPIVGE